MRILINGVIYPLDPATGVEVVVEVDPGGETAGPVSLVLRGGPLEIEGNVRRPNAVRFDYSGLTRGPDGWVLSLLGAETVGRATVVQKPLVIDPADEPSVVGGKE